MPSLSTLLNCWCVPQLYFGLLRWGLSRHLCSKLLSVSSMGCSLLVSFELEPGIASWSLFLAVAVICSYLWPQNITCTWNSGFLPSPALISILGMETLYLYVHQCSFFTGWHVAPRWLSHAVLAQSHPDLQWSNIPWSWCQQSGKWEPLAGNVFVLRLAFNLLLRRQCLILLLLKDNQLKHKDFYSVVDVSCV